RSFTEDIGNELEKIDLIRVNNPRPNQIIQSPILIEGEARGYWFFEATFPIKLINENGEVIVQYYAQTKDDWMTEDFVSFEVELDFEIINTQKGTLILEKSNPSDLPENYDELRIPVILEKTEKTLQTIKLYYYNPDLDKDETGNVFCSKKGLVAVERKIPVTKTPIQDAIKLLLLGELTNEEKDQGITTEYPLTGFSLKGASLKEGSLMLEFNDPNNKTIGGSCRIGILWFQIEATAKQFSQIQEVEFMSENLFQP
ncbi:MAG: Gmad2 immunoglobulin-like domain-containing protein, partial [bacterium]